MACLDLGSGSAITLPGNNSQCRPLPGLSACFANDLISVTVEFLPEAICEAQRLGTARITSSPQELRAQVARPGKSRRSCWKPAGEMHHAIWLPTLSVAVAKSTNGGKTWSAPVPVFRPPFSIGYFGDKDALAVGPDPVVKSRDNLYVTYDDFFFDSQANQAFTGLPVARSTDGGRTWHLAYADKFNLNMTGCSFQQYIGATPIVDHVTGALSPPWLASQSAASSRSARSCSTSARYTMSRSPRPRAAAVR